MSFKFDWDENRERIYEFKRFIEENRTKKGVLMPVLQEAQRVFGYLPIEVQKMIAEGLGVPLSEVYGVATFYSQFSLVPKGKYQIGVCLGTACYVKGAQSIIDKIKGELNLEIGGTTNDGRFSLTATRCIGACGLAPVMTINEDVYGRLTADDIPNVIQKYKE